MKEDEKKPELSVIIVNYNVKEFLASCLQSVINATKSINTEIFVVDNDSTDGSIPFLKEKFSDVIFIENKENVGFGKANNQAIKRSKGRYTLLLNPDTLIQEDTPQILMDFLKKNKQCGACGCKILNPDGTFAPESRRSIPTVSAAVYKAIGLTALFPKSKHFGAYYQGWKSEDQGGEIPVLSGSFMFFRSSCLEEVDGFDERFFMYGEDIDLCYRVTEAGWEIHYVPETSIIHYKGESTKKNELAYNRVFNDAIYKFFNKHFTSRYSKLFKFLIFWAIQVRVIISFFVNNIRSHRHVITDLTILNLALIIGMVIRASFDTRGMISMLQPQFLWLNVLWSTLYLLFMQAYGVLQQNQYSIVGSLKAFLFSFLMLVAVTFFIRDLAFSRIILAVAFILGFTFVAISRFMRVNKIKSTKFSRGKINPLRLLLVGAPENTDQMIQLINSKAGWQVEVAGVILPGSLHSNESRQKGDDGGLPSKVKVSRTDVIIFLMETVTYKQLIRSMYSLRDQDVEMKIVPEGMAFILGKSDVEYLDTADAEKPDLNYFNPVQKVIKRLSDIFVGLTGLIVLLPFSWTWISASRDKAFDIEIFDGRNDQTLSLIGHSSFSNKIVNRMTLCAAIFRGKLSLVGAPGAGDNHKREFTYKTGLTGYVQINRERISESKDRSTFDLHYLQNYSIWLDMDILFKALIREESLTGAFLDKADPR